MNYRMNKIYYHKFRGKRRKKSFYSNFNLKLYFQLLMYYILTTALDL
jgi:hypothetical protein